MSNSLLSSYSAYPNGISRIIHDWTSRGILRYAIYRDIALFEPFAPKSLNPMARVIWGARCQWVCGCKEGGGGGGGREGERDNRLRARCCWSPSTMSNYSFLILAWKIWPGYRSIEFQCTRNLTLSVRKVPGPVRRCEYKPYPVSLKPRSVTRESEAIKRDPYKPESINPESHSRRSSCTSRRRTRRLIKKTKIGPP